MSDKMFIKIMLIMIVITNLIFTVIVVNAIADTQQLIITECKNN